MEDTDLLVLSRHRTLALEDFDLYGRLVIDRGGEGLGLLGRDGGVGFDHLGHDTTHRLDTKAQRGYIEEQDVLDIACEHTALDGCADSYNLIGVNALRRSFAEEFLYGILDSRDTGRTTYEDDLVDIRGCEACVLQRSTTRSDSTLDQVVDELLEFSTGQRLNQVCRYAVYRHDIRQVDLRGRCRRQFDLRFLSRLFQTLHSHRVFGEVGAAVLVLELLNEPVDDTMVEIVTAEVGITVGSFYFEDTVTEFEHGYIVGTTTAVEDYNLHILVGLVEAISQGSCSRLVDNTAYVETCDLAGFLSSLTLRVVEVCRHGDDSIGHFLSEVVLSGLFHLLKDDCRDLLRRIETSVDVHTRSVVVAFGYFIRNTGDLRSKTIIGLTHKTLDRIDSSGRVCDCLTFSRVTYFTLAALDKSDYRRRSTFTFSICDNDGFVTLHYGYTRVRGTEVNSNNFRHSIFPFFC